MNILHVVGARPNFMKVAPVMAAFDKNVDVRQILIHTGQHYDANMYQIFFKELGLPKPDIDLEVGSGSHAEQTGQIMIKFEKVLMERKPDIILVYGDVNSTMAAAIVAAKLHIKVGHVEAGLRSFDRSMPEEINRLVTDQIADMLFTPSLDGNENLLREGVSNDKIYFVGNVMIDTMKRLEKYATLERKREISKDEDYVLVTLHRPSNVDESHMLLAIMATLEKISENIPVIFPIHPRTRQCLSQLSFKIQNFNLQLLDPVGYLDFLSLQKFAKAVITDSGGIQEETTFLGIPCLTVRKNTERPVTVTNGTNILVGQDMSLLRKEVKKILKGEYKCGSVPNLWDGHASDRIADIVCKQLNLRSF